MAPVSARIGVLLAVTWFCFLSAHLDAPAPAPLPATGPLAELGALLAHTEPGSAEERALTRAVARVRGKLHQTLPRADNPGAWLEALAQIKTAPDGTTYRSGYRQRALDSALLTRRAPSEALPWVERGPGNVAGRTRAIVVDAADPTGNTWIIATVGGGIWRSRDAGSSWQDLTANLTTLSTTSLAQCKGSPNVLYAGTGMGYGRIVDLQGSGIWKSTDGGDTWQQLESTAEGQILDAINRIVVDPDDPDVLVVCSNDPFSQLSPRGGTRVSGIFRSEDGGTTWEQTFDPDAVLGAQTDNRVQQIVANPENFATLYATVNEVGVIKSIDAGRTWFVSADDFALPSDINNPPGGGTGLSGVSVRTEMAIAPTDTARLYAAVERPRGVADLYMSTDAGQNWSLLTDTGNDPNWFNAFGNSGAGGAYTAGWFDNTIAVHPFDENVVFVGGVNLYRADVTPGLNQRSTVPIAWWIPNAQGLPVVHADHHWIEPIPGPNSTFRLLNANDGGVAVSNNGGANWTQLTGMGTTQFYGADKHPTTDAYFGGMQDNGTWFSSAVPTSGSPWSFAIGGDGFEVAWHGSDGNLMLGGSQFGNLSRSADGGATWTAIPEAKAGSAPFISKIANDDVDPDLVFTIGSQGVKRSDDFGLTWTLTPIGGPWLGYRPFCDIEVSVAEPQNVWISSWTALDPGTGQTGGVHVSTDGGLSFSRVDPSIPFAGTEASGIATHPLEPQTAYLLYAAPGVPKVIRTTDLGQTWEDLSGFSGIARSLGGSSPTGFPDVAVFSLLVMPFDPDRIWAGTEIGLFESLDGGASWAIADNGLPSVAVFQMRIVEDQVVVATQGRGVWSVELPELQSWDRPDVTLAPRFSRLGMAPEGALAIDVRRPSAYDSTRVWIDGQLWSRSGANPAADVLELRDMVDQSGTRTVQVESFRNGRRYRNARTAVEVFPAIPTNRLVVDFEDAAEESRWLRDRFRVGTQGGFASRSAHSSHPYTDAVEHILQLETPIRVERENAILFYEDVVLVEPGVPGAPWTSANFFDYVVVEGSDDGVNWRALAPGYDASAHPSWAAAWNDGYDGNGNSTGQGSSALLVGHEIDLRNTFAPDTLIFLRFRLHADPAVSGWGWAIDFLSIQGDAVKIEGDGPIRPLSSDVTRLLANAPNPFNPSTSIRFALERAATTRLAIFDVRGRRIHTLVDGELRAAGEHAVTWNGRDERGRPVSSGTYFVRMDVDGRRWSRSIALVK